MSELFKGLEYLSKLVRNYKKSQKAPFKPALKLLSKISSKVTPRSKVQFVQSRPSSDVVVKVSPEARLFGLKKHGNEWYLTEGDHIFDHNANKFITDIKELAPISEDAQIAWQYGQKGNPWFGDLKAIRNRLMRRGASNNPYRTATINEDGSLSVMLKTPEYITPRLPVIRDIAYERPVKPNIYEQLLPNELWLQNENLLREAEIAANNEAAVYANLYDLPVEVFDIW